MRAVEVNAYAKINLFLEVTARRGDGYHDLATLFARVGLCDRLRLEKTGRPGIALKLSNRSVPGLAGPADNLVYKAAAKFFAAFGLEPSVKITLSKRIPVGAGLGGGSSDAAAALLGLCRLYGIGRRRNSEKLSRLALELGSDVPFFLLGETFALGGGRGEILRPLKARRPLPRVLLVYPGEAVYTREVYARLKLGARGEIARRLGDLKQLVRLIEKGRLGRGAPGLLFNRLEEPVLPRHKKVAAAKKELLALGSGAVLMSGSGAAIFALPRDGASAEKMAAHASRHRDYRVFLSDFC